MPLKTMPYDAAKYLVTEEAIAVFLTDAFESGDDAVFQSALKIAARARGMSEVAKSAGVGRESLYKALQVEAQPRFTTVRRVLDALGVELSITVKQKRPAKRRKAAPDEFVARGLASRDLARKSGRYVPASKVVAELEAQSTKAKSKK